MLSSNWIFQHYSNTAALEVDSLYHVCQFSITIYHTKVLGVIKAGNGVDSSSMAGIPTLILASCVTLDKLYLCTSV